MPIVESFRVLGTLIGEPDQDLLFEPCRVNDYEAFRIRPYQLAGGGGHDANRLRTWPWRSVRGSSRRTSHPLRRGVLLWLTACGYAFHTRCTCASISARASASSGRDTAPLRAGPLTEKLRVRNLFADATFTTPLNSSRAIRKSTALQKSVLRIQETYWFPVPCDPPRPRRTGLRKHRTRHRRQD
jgi:hypothetical protein